MINILILPEKLRKRLKKPLGTLITGNFEETIKKLKEIIAKEKPTRIIAVGDAVSRSLIENKILPDVIIVDNRIMRENITPIKFKAEKTVYAKNPAGTISDEAWETVKAALNSNVQTKIVIGGEEDLLALPAVLFAQENSFVIYGQPREGIVIIRVTEEKKAEIKSIVDEMKVVNSKN